MVNRISSSFPGGCHSLTKLNIIYKILIWSVHTEGKTVQKLTQNKQHTDQIRNVICGFIFCTNTIELALI